VDIQPPRRRRQLSDGREGEVFTRYMGITQETLLIIVRTGGIGTALGLLVAVLNYNAG
jgi:hypothetical protein